MSLIMIILSIISAIPTIIKIVQEIMALIHGLKPAEASAAQTQLKGILLKHLKSHDPVAAQKDLEQFHSDLKGKYGV